MDDGYDGLVLSEDESVDVTVDWVAESGTVTEEPLAAVHVEGGDRLTLSNAASGVEEVAGDEEVGVLPTTSSEATGASCAVATIVPKSVDKYVGRNETKQERKSEGHTTTERMAVKTTFMMILLLNQER